MGMNDMGEGNTSPNFVIRDLKSKDVWQMTRIIRKFGIAKIRESIPDETLRKANYKAPTMLVEDGSIVPLPRDKWTEAQIEAEMEAEVAYDDIMWALLEVLLDNIGSCEKEVNALLADGIGRPVGEIYEMDANDYLALIFQYITREGFRDFFMEAWNLFQKMSPSRKASGTVITALTK